jgi:hypothetical protein
LQLVPFLAEPFQGFTHHAEVELGPSVVAHRRQPVERVVLRAAGRDGHGLHPSRSKKETASARLLQRIPRPQEHMPIHWRGYCFSRLITM